MGIKYKFTISVPSTYKLGDESHEWGVRILLDYITNEGVLVFTFYILILSFKKEKNNNDIQKICLKLKVIPRTAWAEEWLQ